MMKLKEEAATAAVMAGYVSEENHNRNVMQAREIGIKRGLLMAAEMAEDEALVYEGRHDSSDDGSQQEIWADYISAFNSFAAALRAKAEEATKGSE